MVQRVRVFIDYWNFQINWNERSPEYACDWARLPLSLVEAAGARLSASGLGELTLAEARVYASYEPSRDHGGKQKNWLHNFLDKQPGIRVFTRERRTRQCPAHCRECGADFPECPKCKAKFVRAAEKGVDSQIVTDLLSLAWENAYDVALLVSSDADFVPVVERLQEKNFKVVNATWSDHGHELARTSWASFRLDDVLVPLRRAASAPGSSSANRLSKVP